MQSKTARASAKRMAALTLATLILAALAAVTASAQADATSATLHGYVRDPQGAVVTGATVTVSNPEVGLTRTAQTNDDGFYQLIQLPPGTYQVAVESANFKRAVVPALKLTVGQQADLDVTLEIGSIGEVVTVTSADAEVVETSRTAVTNTIEQQRIDNLPVNQRDYLGIATTISTVNRGNDRPIGPAPSSGLNIGGQRGRSTLVQVDGADNTDNSVNAARTTVSQEAVQEFQVATNSYAPEFGRAIGGVVNVVTKGGTNELHGNVFGFIRHKSFQARNAFAPVIDNDPSKKPPYTRGQYGFTIGGPLDRGRTFFFGSFEQRRRQESGFYTTQPGRDLTGSVTINGVQFRNLTPAQVSFIQSQLAAGNTAVALPYAYFASSGGSNALNGTTPLVVFPGLGSLTPIPAGQAIGGRFLLTGAPLPTAANNNALPGFQTVDAAGNSIAFRPLNSLARVFPISEGTTFSSARLDHNITDLHQLTMRFGYNPGRLTGIQDESQNQTLGQNDFSRTGIQEVTDSTFVATLHSTLTPSAVNEARFNFGRRRANFFSQNGNGPAIQIAGSSFIGPNPFSPVTRGETRYQYTDTLTLVKGTHTMKFGGDANFISVGANFQLNFPGLFNFGTTNLSPFITGLPANAPPLTPEQSYGVGIPSVFIQGFGNPNSSLRNRPLAWFAQDSWKINRRLTLNYGIRYDVELTQTIPPVPFTDPLTGVTLSASDLQTAQDLLGVQQGFPRDKNNYAPRAGLAWDIKGDGKSVLRAAYGLFYDHPLLAIAFNSDIADASQQQQFTTVLPGSPAPTATLNLLQLFQGTVCSATPNPLCPLPSTFRTPGVAGSAQYLPGRLRFNDQTFVGFGPILPFTLHVAKNFEYAYANQANVTFERQIGDNTSFSASWNFVGAHHLPHPQDINAPLTNLLVENFRRFAVGNPALCGTNAACLANGRAPTSFGEAVLFPIPTANNPLFTVRIPGLVAVNNLTGQTIVSPLAANFFRPSGPNYFFVLGATGGLVSPAAFNAALPGSVRTPGPLSPFGDVSAQLSDGNSVYHAGTFEVKRRFSNNFQFLASYTWAHSIDDSSDLQTLLKPQDNRNFRAERADSLFDQRHRFVFSGVAAAPASWRGSGSAWQRLLSDFIVAPVLEVSSGRPFNIITGTDTNGDLQSSNDRPSVAADGTLVLPGFLQSGNLGRNAGITHGYASLDLRLTRVVRFGETTRLEIIAEGFNLFNKNNEAAASPFFTDVNAFGQRASNGRYFSLRTSSYDQRIGQFGLKFYF